MGLNLNSILRKIGAIQWTILLLFKLFFLILFATFAQVDLGIFEANKKYFTSWIIYLDNTSIPIYLGGYTIGLLLVINLIASHTVKIKSTKAKLGIFLIHFGLVLLIIGSGLTSWLGKEMNMSIKEGATKYYAEFPTQFELVFINTQTKEHDIIYNIDLSTVKDTVTFKGHQITIHHRYPNAMLNQRGIINKKYSQLGQTFKLISMPKTYKMSERNVPGIDISIRNNNNNENRFILWGGSSIYQEYTFNNIPYLIKLRAKRHYFPFGIHLKDFIQKKYQATNTPESFTSKVAIMANKTQTPFNISMNSPLRHKGYTFFQASFTTDETETVLQVVKNPSWLIPYISSLLITIGLFIQMIQSSRKRKRDT